MKCKLCESYFVKKQKFNNLFTFEEICPKCLSKYKPIVKTEVIPYFQGSVVYIYLYSDMQINKKQLDCLSLNYCYIFDYITENKLLFDIIVIIDDYNYEFLQKEIKYLLPFKKIIFMSLLRYEFDNFVIFY